MSFVQRLLTAMVPRSWAASMEAESRAWMARCESCGTERSVWDLGGIRWKAAGDHLLWLKCPGCGRGRRHRLRKA